MKKLLLTAALTLFASPSLSEHYLILEKERFFYGVVSISSTTLKFQTEDACYKAADFYTAQSEEPRAKWGGSKKTISARFFRASCVEVETGEVWASWLGEDQ